MSTMASGPASLLGSDSVGATATKRGAARRIGARDASVSVSVLPSHHHFSLTGSTGQNRENTRFRRTGHVTLGARRSGHEVAAASSASASSASADSFGGDIPPEKVKGMQRKTLGLMFSTYTSIYFVRKPFSVVKAPMQDALNLTTGAIAGIDSAFLGLYAIGQLTLPSLGDKLGARKMLVVGYLLSAAACFGFGLTSFPILLVRLAPP